MRNQRNWNKIWKKIILLRFVERLPRHFLMPSSLVFVYAYVIALNILLRVKNCPKFRLKKYVKLRENQRIWKNVLKNVSFLGFVLKTIISSTTKPLNTGQKVP